MPRSNTFSTEERNRLQEIAQSNIKIGVALESYNHLKEKKHTLSPEEKKKKLVAKTNLANALKQNKVFA